MASVVNVSLVPFGNAYYSRVTGNLTYDRGPGMSTWLRVCGATHPPEGCFGDVDDILCQHGANECVGNIVQGCAIRAYPTTYWPFIACYAAAATVNDTGTAKPSRTDPAAPWRTLQHCAAQLGLDHDLLRSCATDLAVASADQRRCVLPYFKPALVRDHLTSSSLIDSLRRHARRTAALSPPHGGTPWVLVDGQVLGSSEDGGSGGLLDAICAAFKGDRKPDACAAAAAAAAKSSGR